MGRELTSFLVQQGCIKKAKGIYYAKTSSFIELLRKVEDAAVPF